MLYIIIAFIAGIMVIMSLIVNSTLAKRVGVFQGTFLSYSVALLCALVVFLVSKAGSGLGAFTLKDIPLWAYLGGVLGVCVVAISNVIIPKIPAIYSTLLIFVGQLFSGIAIDYFKDGMISKGKILGGLLILLGMLYNFQVDRQETKEKAAAEILT